MSSRGVVNRHLLKVHNSQSGFFKRPSLDLEKRQASKRKVSVSIIPNWNSISVSQSKVQASKTYRNKNRVAINAKNRLKYSQKRKWTFEVDSLSLKDHNIRKFTKIQYLYDVFYAKWFLASKCITGNVPQSILVPYQTDSLSKKMGNIKRNIKIICRCCSPIELTIYIEKRSSSLSFKFLDWVTVRFIVIFSEHSNTINRGIFFERK